MTTARVAIAVAAACAGAACKEPAKAPTGGAPPTPVVHDAAPAPPPPSDAAAAHAEPLPALPPAPPLPAVPRGLPPVNLGAAVTPANVALGELLFFDPRLGKGGAGACVTCHDPDLGWASRDARSTTLAGKPNLRHTPPLVNLAWVPELGWDGRFPSMADAIRSHWRGQLDVDPVEAVSRLAAVPVYRAHFQRAAGGPPSVDAAIAALGAFVRTRYQGDAWWDRFERDRDALPAELAGAEAGYLLFRGKAQCAVCHVPPLYTDHAFHRLGLIATPDEGRGRVEPARAGAFRTPTLRGATLHPPYFHDGSAPDLDTAIDWHLAGGVGQGAGKDAIDPALAPVTLTPEERAQLGAFVRALAPAEPRPYPRPELP